MTSMIKMINSTFFKNTSEKGGAMTRAINEHTPNSILMHSQTKKHGRLWGFSTPNQFLTNLEKNNGLYEIIHHFPHKVYFDIDAIGSGVLKGAEPPNFKEFIDKVKRIILGYFPDADLAISGSHTPEKASLHLVLNNYSINNEADRTHMKALAQYIQATDLPSCDWKVYTKNRNMKCINQSKLDGRVQQIIENPDYKKHIITCFFNSSTLPLPILSAPIMEQIAIAKSKTTFDLGLLPKLVLACPDDIDYDSITPAQCLSLLPIDKSFSHDYTHLVARFCNSNNLTFQTFCSWYAKKNSTEDAFKKWRIHFDNIGKFPDVSLLRMKTIMSAFYPHIKKDIHYRRFTQTFVLPEENMNMIETIDQTTFNTDKKYIVHNIGMGGGKTAQTITYLKDHHDFLWIAPNRALASNTKKRFEDEQIHIQHYEGLTTKQKKDGELNHCKELIICLNSLHYLNTKTYQVLVIDEIETLIDKFQGNFMCGKTPNVNLKLEIWQIFINLFRRADKVILLDAFITTKTLNLIKAIEGNLNQVAVFKRVHEPQTRTINYHTNFEMSIHSAIEKIKNGSKVFIFYPFKNANKKFGSMEQIFQLIKEQTGKDGIYYNADVCDTTKAELRNVNEAWDKRNFVITNNILTCGVNYEGLDFDYKFLFIAPHNVPRDIIQVSYRARYLSTGQIFVCYLGVMNTCNTWLDDCRDFKCPIYTSLYNSILVEKKAPIKRAFQLFCVKAHYNQVSDRTTICDRLTKEMHDLITNYQTGYSYDSIEVIEPCVAEYIQECCFAQEATAYQKMMLRKYFYIKNFTEEGLKINVSEDTNLVQYCWDNNYHFFFDQIKNLLLTKNNIFEQIRLHNKQDSFLQFDNLKKIKLTEPFLDQIFTEFKFRSISRNSSTQQILRSIYNTFFGKFIIEVVYPEKENGIDKKKNNITYTMDDPIYENIYQFCKQHLILDQDTKAVKNHVQIQDSDEPFEI